MKVFTINLILVFALTMFSLNAVCLAAAIPAGCKDTAKAGFKCANIKTGKPCKGLGKCEPDGSQSGVKKCKCASDNVLPTPGCQCAATIK